MAKAPASQFYVKDYLSDPQLQMASHISKGIWMDMLCSMWVAPIQGEVSGAEKQVQRLVRASGSDWEKFKDEIMSLGFGDIECENGNVTVRNRRMYREFWLKKTAVYG